MRTLEERVSRLKAGAECQRIAASYSGYLSGAQYEKLCGLFSNRKDIWASMPWGTYRGESGVQRLYQGLYRSMYCTGEEMKSGVLTVHGMNTPVITVAEDGQSAQGSWASPGAVTVERQGAPNGLQSYWSWNRFNCDFILESGAWKILHLQMVPFFTTEFEKSWTDAQNDIFSAIPAEYAADAPAVEAPPELELPEGTEIGTWTGNPWENSFEVRITRLELLAEAQRLMGLYSNFMAEKRFEQIPKLFALDVPTVRAEMLWGVYDGKESIHRLYTKLFPDTVDGAPGRIAERVQSLEVPIITAARDALTAKGVWVGPGYMNLVDDGGNRKGYWSWQKYAADFIRTDQGLKIWHLHVYGLFESEYGSGEICASGTYGCHIPEYCQPDRAPTTSFQVSPDSVYPYEPAVPKPYSVFDPDYSY